MPAGTPDLLSAKIETAKRGARRAGVDLFVNARVDVVLRQLVPREKAIEETGARAAVEDGQSDAIYSHIKDAPDMNALFTR
jgi:2-methylisocitrate lyase-like PEP mutase family enzyme